MGDMTRDQLILYYGLSVNDFGRYSSIAEPEMLLTTAFRQAGLAATADRNYSDDDLDYTNAIIDQLRFLHNMIFWYDNFASTELRDEALLHVLNQSRDDAADDMGDDYGFHYGYSDHNSHISDLARMNDDD